MNSRICDIKTVAVAQALFLALANHPEVQVKAQAELDAVVGKGRLPLITDRPALPYVHAVMKEAGRWYNSSPIGTCLACPTSLSAIHRSLPSRIGPCYCL